MLKRLLIVAALISVVACGNKSPSSPSGSGSGGTTLNGSTFALSVTGGQTFTPNVIQVSLQPPVLGGPEYLALTVGSSQGAGFAIVVPTGITTYTVTSTLLGATTYSETSGATSSSWQAGPGIGGSGSIVITGRTATTISGTFNVTLTATTGASSGSRTCTGSFTAKIA